MMRLHGLQNTQQHIYLYKTAFFIPQQKIDFNKTLLKEKCPIARIYFTLCLDIQYICCAELLQIHYTQPPVVLQHFPVSAGAISFNDLVSVELRAWSYLAFPNLPGVAPVFFFFDAEPLTSGFSTYS